MKTLKLKKPIQYGSETISELQVHEPTAKDLRSMPLDMGKATLGMMLDVAANCARQAPSVIDMLSMEDTMALAEMIGDFLPGSPQTGPTP
ncbi:tail assembly chaperone protein [Bordetella phage PY223]